MGLLDDASKMLDAATGGKPTSKVEAKPEFLLKDILSIPEKGDVGSVGISHSGQNDNPNPLDGGITTEFIHFGNVHPDTGKKFPHNNFNPDDAQNPPKGHAIMFRDAVEREGVALFGFVSSTRIILKEATEQRGALDSVGDMASNLLGGDSKKSKPDPTQLDTFLSDIETAIQTINKPSIIYKEVHEAGKKLHETRATYIAFCKTLNDFYLQPPSGNPLDMAAGAIADVPGVGNIMGIVQRFAFKMFDLYLAAYLELRQNHEKNIETAAHDLTIEAIKGNYAEHKPTYPVWFKKPEKKDDGADEDKDNLLKDVNEKIDETKKDVQEQVDKVYDFLGTNGDPEQTPGSANLGAIFGSLKGSPETTPDALPSASACLINGMNAAMTDIHGIPDFVKNAMAKINDANLGLLGEVFARLMAKEISAEIDSQLLLEAGRRHLSQKIVSIMGDLASGILPGGSKDFSMNTPDGKKLSAQAFIAKLLEDKLVHYVDPIIKYTIGDLAGQLEASRKKAQDNKAQTMEVLLGRLPWLTALMFKNTFFPIWNLVVEKVFETVSPQIAKVVKEVNSVFEKAKDKVDTASDYQHRAEHVQEKAASGVSSVDDLKQVKDSADDESPEAQARRAKRDKADREKQALDDFYKPNDKDEKFPVASRVADGKGEKVTEDVESVIKTPTPDATQSPAATPSPQGLPTDDLKKEE
ncbi:MAG: hypothetical protein ACR2N3_08590 [Pyrinomonadaceae bacterium]